MANLAGIILAGVVVILATGLASTQHRLRLIGSIGLATALAAAVGVPLQARSMELVARAQTARAVNAEVLSWLGSGNDLKLIDGRDLRVSRRRRRGRPARSAPAQTLAESLARDLGEGVAVDVRWFARSGSGTQALGSEQKVAAAPKASDTVRSIADKWTAQHLGLSVLRVGVDGTHVTIDITGAVPPTSTADVVMSIEEALGRQDGGHHSVQPTSIPEPALTDADTVTVR